MKNFEQQLELLLKNSGGYQIQDFNRWVKRVIQLDPEHAAESIKQYGDIRETKGIEEAWEYSRRVLKRAMRNRTNRLKKEDIGFNEYTASIDISRFIDYFAALEEELKFQMQHAGQEGRKVAEIIHDQMWNKLGNIKIDKRKILPFRED